MTQTTLDGTAETPPDGLTRAELAAALAAEHPDFPGGVTTQTIGNWEKRGIVKALNPGESPRRYPASALDRLRAEITTARHGGAREGAGRPRKEPDAPLGRAIERAQTKRDLLERAKARGEADLRPEDAIPIEALLTIDYGELRLLASVCDEVNLTPRQAELVGRLLDNRKKHRLELEAEGRLVDLDAARAALEPRIAALKHALLALPATLAARAVTLVDGSPERQPALEVAIRDAIEKILVESGGRDENA